MLTIAEFVESLDLSSEKKDDLRRHLQNLQEPLSDPCQAAVLQALFEAKGWPATFLPYDKAKLLGALENLGEWSAPGLYGLSFRYTALHCWAALLTAHPVVNCYTC